MQVSYYELQHELPVRLAQIAGKISTNCGLTQICSEDYHKLHLQEKEEYELDPVNLVLEKDGEKNDEEILFGNGYQEITTITNLISACLLRIPTISSYPME
ncbi:hypothetical protein CHS0354_005178 [Potamilus streckersoni]|uniref:Uncharacterized protein n=1 Tax=Potamilus streckersoni TaxID=2493646 RepID=A0AAE0RV73_9BIVA|nr:hypothetical protein CHS0354_005178 [Potamilus streckersoni]